MAATLSSTKITYLLTDTFNGYIVEYKLEKENNEFKPSVSAEAKTAEGRHICSLVTQDGANFYGSVNMNSTDDTTGLIDAMMAEIIAIAADKATAVGEV